MIQSSGGYRHVGTTVALSGDSSKVSSPRSESGGDNLPTTLPVHPGEATGKTPPSSLTLPSLLICEAHAKAARTHCSSRVAQRIDSRHLQP